VLSPSPSLAAAALSALRDTQLARRRPRGAVLARFLLSARRC
jgi:hypothetical protein